ncbi:hypothetical protein [Phascolarctobacterium succinatutens]|uniref:hypothetical protein n=1 Tax=Phascolarctobacterium succinatutens TaxID=626940 RepID=UPI0030777794
MKRDESNLISLLIGIGIGWLGFTVEGQQVVRNVLRTVKTKYKVIDTNEKKEGNEDVKESE